MEYGAEDAAKILETIKNNPSLLQEGKTVHEVVQEIGKIEKTIKETGVLQKLLKEAKFTQRHDHQWETIIGKGKDRILVLIRRDIGKYAHPLPGSKGRDINHWNIEIKKILREIQYPSGEVKLEFEKYYNHHIIVDDKLNVMDAFGKY